MKYNKDKVLIVMEDNKIAFQTEKKQFKYLWKYKYINHSYTINN